MPDPRADTAKRRDRFARRADLNLIRSTIADIDRVVAGRGIHSDEIGQAKLAIPGAELVEQRPMRIKHADPAFRFLTDEKISQAVHRDGQGLREIFLHDGAPTKSIEGNDLTEGGFNDVEVSSGVNRNARGRLEALRQWRQKSSSGCKHCPERYQSANH